MSNINQDNCRTLPSYLSTTYIDYLCLLRGAALMAEWSQASPLTAYCLSRLPGFESCACEKVVSDLGLGGGFSPGTPVSSGTYNWLVTHSGINVMKNEIPNYSPC